MKHPRTGEYVSWFWEGQIPTAEEYVAETERLHAVAAKWKKEHEQAALKLHQMEHPPKSHAEERLDALRERSEYERQSALDERMKALRL